MDERLKKVKINYESDLIFQCVDWIECDEIINDSSYDKPQYQREHNKRYTIFCFGVTKEGYSVCVKIVNYKPYFQVKIPDDWSNNKLKKFENAFFNREELGTDEDYEEFDIQDEIAQDNGRSWIPKNIIDKMKTVFWKSSLIHEDISIEEREIFWTFMNHKKHKFWKLPFKSKAGLKLFHNYLINKQTYLDFEKKDTPLSFKLFQSDLEPLLKFFHDSKIQPSNWIKIPKNTFISKSNLSSCQINIETDWTNINHFENAMIPPLISASFDIECDSSHGDFPLPKKDCKKLANQLVIAYLREINNLHKNDKKSEKYKLANKNLSERENFFRNRILQALGFKSGIDSEIDTIYFKSRKDLKKLINKPEFDKLCRSINQICNRPIRSIKANM